jgi:hypothetical protein
MIPAPSPLLDAGPQSMNGTWEGDQRGIRAGENFVRSKQVPIRYCVAIFTAAFGGLRVGETLGDQGAESESAQAPPRCRGVALRGPW